MPPRQITHTTCKTGECQRGSYYCPEAERLWSLVTLAYQDAIRQNTTNPHAWTQYDAARQTYEEHFTRHPAK